MKKITLLLSVLLVSIGYSQTDLETFEGAAPTIGIANATAGTAANIVANPSVDANNGSATVLQFITGDAGDPWQQAELTLQGDFLDLSATGASFSMDVYSMEAFDVLVRVTDGVASNGSTAADSAADAIHGGTGWETLTFDFSAGETQDGLGVPTGVYGKIYIFNLWDANDAGTGAGGWSCNPFGAPEEACPATTRYYDNINGIAAGIPETCSDGIQNNGETDVDCGGPNCDACAAPPTVAAPTPPARDPADVKSIFSNSYSDIPTTGFQIYAAPAHTVVNIDVESNTTLASSPAAPGNAFAYEYFTGGSGTPDISGMNTLHVDVYLYASPDPGAVWQAKVISDIGRVEQVVTLDLGLVTPGTWYSADLPIDLTGYTDLDILQIFAAGPINYGTIYMDNIYFHNNQVLSTEQFDTAEFSVFPNPTKNVWNIKGNNVLNSVSVYDVLGKNVINLEPNTNEVEIDATTFKTGLYFARIESVNGTKTIKLIKN